MHEPRGWACFPTHKSLSREGERGAGPEPESGRGGPWRPLPQPLQGRAAPADGGGGCSESPALTGGANTPRGAPGTTARSACAEPTTGNGSATSLGHASILQWGPHSARRFRHLLRTQPLQVLHPGSEDLHPHPGQGYCEDGDVLGERAPKSPLPQTHRGLQHSPVAMGGSQRPLPTTF